MAFQGNAFQGNAFQIGTDTQAAAAEIFFGWASATTTRLPRARTTLSVSVPVQEWPFEANPWPAAQQTVRSRLSTKSSAVAPYQDWPFVANPWPAAQKTAVSRIATRLAVAVPYQEWPFPDNFWPSSASTSLSRRATNLSVTLPAQEPVADPAVILLAWPANQTVTLPRLYVRASASTPAMEWPFTPLAWTVHTEQIIPTRRGTTLRATIPEQVPVADPVTTFLAWSASTTTTRPRSYTLLSAKITATFTLPALTGTRSRGIIIH